MSMPNAFAHQLKQHAKNIPFFFKVCKKAELIPSDLNEPSHAQNLEIVARLFGYADFHDATNNAVKEPLFNGETKILLEVVQKINPEFDFKNEDQALNGIKEIVKTLGIEISAEVTELGRYSILLDTFPKKRFKIAENTLCNFISSKDGGLWKFVSLNVLFQSLQDYPNFNDVQADCTRPLNTISAFKPTALADQQKIETALEKLLPMCNYHVYDKEETAFCFADYADAQAMMFDICYGVEKQANSLPLNDVEERIQLRRKIRKYRDWLNGWGNSGFESDKEHELLEFFTHAEILQIKQLCAVYSYALKVFLNLRSDMAVFQDYFYFDEYGSLSVNQSIWTDFSVNESESSEDHEFNYSYLTELHEIENPSSMNFIVYKIIEEMSADLMFNAPRKDSIAHQFNFVFDYLHESMDMYYLFNDDVEPKALDDGQTFIGTYFLFSHFKPNIVQAHFKRYHLVNDFPI